MPRAAYFVEMPRLFREFRRSPSKLKASRIEPCLPSSAAKPPNGPGWQHEIKYDGYRMMIHREADRFRVLTRKGHDWTARFPLMVATAKAIKADQFLIDGEAVVCDENGLAMFDRMRYRRNQGQSLLFAFDLLFLNGIDLRREPIEERKAALAKLIRPKHQGIRFVEHLEFDDGDMIFKHACELGCEGIVSKRLGSRYVSGRTRDWIKVKNPTVPAVRRETEEDWN